MSQRRRASPLPPASALSIPDSAHPHSRHRRGIAGCSGAIGLQIQHLREKAATTSTALAVSSGISCSQMSRIERGLVSPSISALEKISRALGVPIGRLFDIAAATESPDS
jgi:DNA-binding XRE family transcriptional regulator